MREGPDIDLLQARIRAALKLADDLRLYDVAARLDAALICLSGTGADPEGLLAALATVRPRIN
ncbi:hypothetical protein [Sphingomonas immobilis]|jgi:hypothetical protein|uniref:Uncharacterized protein n=1 Tax=Sphingomonas immobilis TaxID=3063997 RepID=A0ABT8ZVK5_9SPHN|nr:hypothetical protein [Sphingomonas sp. CA1-15]MDO7841308.1 hypothetical protein [Sphingomonas sp. CA1-15]